MKVVFFVSIYKSVKSKLGFAVQLVFKITQHSRDQELLEGIAKFFACGRVEKRRTKACDLTINSLDSLEKKVLPFLSKYPLFGSKFLDYEDFFKVVEIMRTKNHLTEEGLQKIKNIKANMNTKRYNK